MQDVKSDKREMIAIASEIGDAIRKPLGSIVDRAATNSAAVKTIAGTVRESFASRVESLKASIAKGGAETERTMRAAFIGLIGVRAYPDLFTFDDVEGRFRSRPKNDRARAAGTYISAIVRDLGWRGVGKASDPVAAFKAAVSNALASGLSLERATGIFEEMSSARRASLALLAEMESLKALPGTVDSTVTEATAK